MLACPFCGAPETDRLDLEGRRFLVFRCMFSPEVALDASEAELAAHLKSAFAGAKDTYFRGTCDRLHLYVTKGEGARQLTGASPPLPPAAEPSAK